MTNYEKILKTNLYDFLNYIDTQIAIQKLNGNFCIIDILEGKPTECLENKCSDCIQKYLHKQANGRRFEV